MVGRCFSVVYYRVLNQPLTMGYACIYSFLRTFLRCSCKSFSTYRPHKHTCTRTIIITRVSKTNRCTCQLTPLGWDKNETFGSLFFLFQLSSKVKRLSRQSFKIEDKQYYEIHPVISAASCTLFLIPEHFSRQLSPSCSAIRVVVGAVVVA